MPKESQKIDFQSLYRENLIGFLVYTVVIGFFVDYTELIWTPSYSTTFLVSALMQVLTYPTLLLKKKVTKYFKERDGKLATFFSVWGIMFFSKFIFLEAIDQVFGDRVEISVFFGDIGDHPLDNLII